MTFIRVQPETLDQARAAVDGRDRGDHHGGGRPGHAPGAHRGDTSADRGGLCRVRRKPGHRVNPGLAGLGAGVLSRPGGDRRDVPASGGGPGGQRGWLLHGRAAGRGGRGDGRADRLLGGAPPAERGRGSLHHRRLRLRRAGRGRRATSPPRSRTRTPAYRSAPRTTCRSGGPRGRDRSSSSAHSARLPTSSRAGGPRSGVPGAHRDGLRHRRLRRIRSGRARRADPDVRVRRSPAAVAGRRAHRQVPERGEVEAAGLWRRPATSRHHRAARGPARPLYRRTGRAAGAVHRRWLRPAGPRRR